MRRAYVEGLSKTGFTVFLLGHDVPKQFPAFTKNGGGSFDMERILDMVRFFLRFNTVLSP